jgi:hypothetical protein
MFGERINLGGTRMKRWVVSLGVAVLVCLPISALAGTTYTFTEFVYPGDTFTQTLGINNLGNIAGYHGAVVNMGFVLTPPSTFTTENFPGSVMTQVIGINGHGETVGFYVDTAGITNGFLSKSGVTFKTVDFPNTTFNQLLGINDIGEAAGYWQNAECIDFPYVYSERSGGFLSISIAGSVSAQATGIDDAGAVSGFYIDSAGVNHGFLKSDGVLTTLDFPGGTFTQALGLNSKEVVGFYLDTSGLSHGFVYSNGTFTSVDEPNGVGTTVINGVNALGDIVGFYVDSSGNTDGFEGTPQ